LKLQAQRQQRLNATFALIRPVAPMSPNKSIRRAQSTILKSYSGKYRIRASVFIKIQTVGFLCLTQHVPI
jgi:hypothetical protein